MPVISRPYVHLLGYLCRELIPKNREIIFLAVLFVFFDLIIYLYGGSDYKSRRYRNKESW